MLYTTNKAPQQLTKLRCVWMPMHTGANAPLTAVWIETIELDSPNKEALAPSFDGADLLPRAA